MLPGAPFKGVDHVFHDIDTGNSQPQYTPPYPKSPAQLQIIKEEIQKMIEQGILEPSNSPWGAPCISVKKKSEHGMKISPRLVVDYRKLNKVTKPDVYPLPNIQTILDQLGGKTWFTKLDMFSGFWHIPISPRDKEKTAVITHVGLFQFKRLPFGLRNAPASFQRLVNAVFSDLLFPRDEAAYLSAYGDDLLCHSVDWESHLRHIENVFRRCEKFGLSLKPSKCEFGKHEQEFLGHRINSNGRRPDETKMKAVSDFPVPQNCHDVQKFLGLAGYYRYHIESFASRSFHSRQLTRKNTVFSWGTKEQTEFNDLKAALCSDSVMLHHPDWSKPFLIQTDASAKGLGAVLSQLGLDGKERPVRYASRTLQPLESKWTTREQELIAVIWACETFHRYIWGQHFIIQTDHANLQWLQSVSPQKGRLARWAMRLAAYEFDLQHKPGRANGNADAFSRCPIEPNCHYAEDYYSGFEVEPFVDFYTFITLSTMLGFTQEDQISTDNNACYLPFDFSLTVYLLHLKA